MKINLFCCGESGAVDVATGRISIFHILDVATVPQIPFVFSRISLATVMEREEGTDKEGSVTLLITSQDVELFRGNIIYNFSTQSISRTMMNIQNLVVPYASDLIFKLLSKDEQTELAKWTIKISYIAPQVIQSTRVEPSAERRRKKSL